MQDSDIRVQIDMDRAKREGYHFGAKLVRGAYMFLEKARAKSKGYPSPIWDTIEDTHKCYNRYKVHPSQANLAIYFKNFIPFQDKHLSKIDISLWSNSRNPQPNIVLGPTLPQNLTSQAKRHVKDCWPCLLKKNIYQFLDPNICHSRRDKEMECHILRDRQELLLVTLWCVC